MNRQEVEEQVLDAVRACAVVTTEAPIPLSEPLAKLGFVDSLALVQLVTAIETRFQVELPDAIWTDREALTLDLILEAVASSGSVAAVVPRAQGDAAEIVAPSRSESAQSKHMKVLYALQERGLIGGMGWVLERFGQFIKPRTYERIPRVLVECSLDRTMRSHGAAIELEIREAEEADATALSAFFASFGRRMDEELLRWRLRNGYFCFFALHDETIVGMNWISAQGDQCPFTGLRFKMLPRSCYGLDLYEHADFSGKGVGLALLSHGVIQARARGFAKQVSWVDASNTKMLGAAIHLLDFVKVGSIRTTRILQRPFSQWELAGRSSRGGPIEI